MSEIKMAGRCPYHFEGHLHVLRAQRGHLPRCPATLPPNFKMSLSTCKDMKMPAERYMGILNLGRKTPTTNIFGRAHTLMVSQRERIARRAGGRQ